MGLLAPFFVDDILHVGAEGMSVLMSVSGAGAMLACVVLASLPNRNRGLVMLVAGFFLGVALCGFAASGFWPVSLILIALVGIGGTVNGTMVNTLVQYHTEASYQGRVMGAIQHAVWASKRWQFCIGTDRPAVRSAVGGRQLCPGPCVDNGPSVVLDAPCSQTGLVALFLVRRSPFMHFLNAVESEGEWAGAVGAAA